MAFDSSKYPVMKITAGGQGPSLFSFGTDDDYDDVLAVGHLDTLVDKRLALANRWVQNGDLIDIYFMSSPTGCVRFYVSYDSVNDTYQLIACTMGTSEPLPPTTTGIIAAGDNTWSGGLSKLTLTIPGGLFTDFLFLTIKDFGTSPSGCSLIAYENSTTEGQYDIYLNAADTTNSLQYSWMLIRPAN